MPFADGGPTDVIAVVAQKLSEEWGQQVYTENMPGAGGNAGVTMVGRAPADGYTVLVVSTGFIVNPTTCTRRFRTIPVKDFAPITLVATSPNVISVDPELPSEIDEGADRTGEGQPGRMPASRSPPPARPLTSPASCSSRCGLDLVTCLFDGAALAVNSTIGGHTPIAFTALPPAMSDVEDGKLRGLAVLASARSPALPDVPTNAEAGVPDLESDTLAASLRQQERQTTLSNAGTKL